MHDGYAETLAYCDMPREHWQHICTNSAIKRLSRSGNVIFLSQIESRIRLGTKKTWSSAIGMVFSDQA